MVQAGRIEAMSKKAADRTQAHPYVLQLILRIAFWVCFLPFITNTEAFGTSFSALVTPSPCQACISM
jgi:hypothetical protein